VANAAAALANQNNRPARRLYVGGLPDDVAEIDIQHFFNGHMMRLAPHSPPGDVVLSIYLNREKKFGFVEFRSVEEAAAGLALDGVDYGGSQLRLKRPNDYVAPAQGPLDPMPGSGVLGGALSNQVPDGPNKVFCGGIPNQLRDDQLVELLSVYGPLKGLHLVKDPQSGCNKGFGFFEYMDPAVTEEALDVLGTVCIGPKTLTFRRAQAKDTMQVSGFDPSNPLSALSLPALPSMLTMAGQPRAKTTATRVLIMSNMLTKEDLALDAASFKDLSEDIESEMRNFGDVVRLEIPRAADGRPTPGFLRVFVEFRTPAQAAAAFADVDGREFGDAVVSAAYMDEDRYRRGEREL
jgi:splicing factor U2AF subunit